MTFLELCVRLREEAGISGTGPSSVANQTGEYKRLVNWIGTAWNEIQLKHKEWLFLRGYFTFQTTNGDYDYTPVEAGIATRFARWETNSIRLYQTSLGVNDEIELGYITYEEYRRLYLTGVQTNVRPMAFSIKPDLSLLLAPHPNGIYTVSGEYYKKPQALSVNADVPDLPDEFHMLIVYEALKKYALFEAANEVFSYAQIHAGMYMAHLETDQLPDVSLPEPMV